MVGLIARAAFRGLKARNVIAWAEGPGWSTDKISKPCKGDTRMS
jgi:hypothetical protein